MPAEVQAHADAKPPEIDAALLKAIDAKNSLERWASKRTFSGGRRASAPLLASAWATLDELVVRLKEDKRTDSETMRSTFRRDGRGHLSGRGTLVIRESRQTPVLNKKTSAASLHEMEKAFTEVSTEARPPPTVQRPGDEGDRVALFSHQPRRARWGQPLARADSSTSAGRLRRPPPPSRSTDAERATLVGLNNKEKRERMRAGQIRAHESCGRRAREAQLRGELGARRRAGGLGVQRAAEVQDDPRQRWRDTKWASMTETLEAQLKETKDQAALAMDKVKSRAICGSPTPPSTPTTRRGCRWRRRR